MAPSEMRQSQRYLVQCQLCVISIIIDDLHTASPYCEYFRIYTEIPNPGFNLIFQSAKLFTVFFRGQCYTQKNIC